MDKKQGFSLMELTIVIAIIGIIALFALPNYHDIITHARRSDGQAALIAMATKMEEHYAKHHSYQDAMLDAGQTSAENWYSLRITQQTDLEYTLEAIPLQADTACQTLTFNSAGIKGITQGLRGKPTATAKQCWQ